MSAGRDAGVDGGSLAEAFLSHHLTYRPVDATFMGLEGHDALLPPCAAGAEAAEKAGLAALKRRLYAEPEPQTSGERLDRRIVASELEIAAATLDVRPRFLNPAWYSGEAAFSIISLLLPQSEPTRRKAVHHRLQAIPDFLADARSRLAGGEAPRSWTERAQREAAAFGRFLTGDLRLHPDWDERWGRPAALAERALREFVERIDNLPHCDPACGEAHLAMLMRVGHALDLTPSAALQIAEEAFDRLGEELAEMAAQIDPTRPWQKQIEALADQHPASNEAVLETYRSWHTRAEHEGGAFVTLVDDYNLDYRPIAPWFRNIARELYFLFYRSPPAGRPGRGSIYWVAVPGDDQLAYLRANNCATVKTIHSVHHGSIGHHTQNRRARDAQGQLARLGGTDCALGIAFLSAGTMVEGWACYVEDLLIEAPGFYDPTELLLLKQYERRNAASVLVDVRIHTGEWTLDEAVRFYRDEAGFAPARVHNEVTRNSMLPGTRLMYWIGVEAIKNLRSKWRGDVRAFHDTLIGYGHVPVTWAGNEMERAGHFA